jgi:hypothetical protein
MQMMYENTNAALRLCLEFSAGELEFSYIKNNSQRLYKIYKLKLNILQYRITYLRFVILQYKIWHLVKVKSPIRKQAKDMKK